MPATALNRAPAETGGPPPATREPASARSDDLARVKRRTHRWSRLIHVYTSMVALLVVLFFAITGITLNHPAWTFGDATDTETVTGTFPFDTQLTAADGTEGSVDFLSISEYVRINYDVRGDVDSFEETTTATSTQGSITFKNPGYSADLFFDVDTGEFELTVEQQGWVAVMNDLHKGRDTGSAWKWVIDVAAGFLVVISVTGLTMQFFLRKRRRSLLAAGAGAIVLIALIAITLR
jgi:hypothetical protein